VAQDRLARALHELGQQPVVRPDQDLAIDLDNRDRPGSAHTRIDDGDVHRPRREVAVRPRQPESALDDVLGRHVVHQVDQRRLRVTAQHLSFHDTDERVALPEIRCERDDA
jgi:hypothetical protein